MPKKKKPQVGRPSKWNDKFLSELPILMAQGYKDVQIMAKWGISADTFYRWLKENKDLKAAYDEALPQCQNFWEMIGFKGMVGEIKGFRENMWKAFMQHKFEEWKETPESKSQITIGQMQVLNNYSDMSKDQLLEHIKSKLAINHINDGFKQPIEGTTDGTGDILGSAGKEETREED